MSSTLHEIRLVQIGRVMSPRHYYVVATGGRTKMMYKFLDRNRQRLAGAASQWCNEEGS